LQTCPHHVRRAAPGRERPNRAQRPHSKDPDRQRSGRSRHETETSACRGEWRREAHRPRKRARPSVCDRERVRGGTVLTVAGRDLSSEASAPGSVAPCRGRLAGRGADTSAIPSSRVGTVATGTAPAGGWPLAPRYGSDLLPLRLPLLLQRGDVVFHAAPSRRFHGLCQVRSLPAAAPSFRARFASEAGLLAGWARRMTRLRSGLRSSNQNPLGHCVGARVETSRGPDSARAWFLITPNRSTPDFVELNRTRLRSEELVRHAYQTACAMWRGRRNQLPSSFPRSPGIIPAVLAEA